VAEWKYRAHIVELDTNAVPLSYREKSRAFVAIAMREVDYTIANTKRFTGRVNIA
jgi:hypothetical protein